MVALTIVPVLAYYLFKPVRWPRRRALALGGATGAAAMLATYGVLRWGLGASGA